MTWELKEVNDIECTMDDSGVYIVVHRVVDTVTHKERAGKRIRVRADLMQKDGHIGGDAPVMSWIGTANAVRKHLIRFMDESPNILPFSYEHASYIGYELLRAETDPNYVQD